MIDLTWIKHNPKTTAAGIVAAIAALVRTIWPESPWPEAIIGAAVAFGLVVARDGDVGERRAETGRRRGGQLGRRRRVSVADNTQAQIVFGDAQTFENPEQS